MTSESVALQQNYQKSKSNFVEVQPKLSESHNRLPTLPLMNHPFMDATQGSVSNQHCLPVPSYKIINSCVQSNVTPKAIHLAQYHISSIKTIANNDLFLTNLLLLTPNPLLTLTVH